MNPHLKAPEGATLAARDKSYTTNGRYIYGPDRRAILDCGYGLLPAPDLQDMTEEQKTFAHRLVALLNGEMESETERLRETLRDVASRANAALSR